MHKTIVLVIFALLMGPFLALLAWGFTHNWLPGDLVPSQLGFRGWRHLVDPHSRVLESLVVSVLLSLGATFLSLAISIPAGKALGLCRFPGKNAVETFLLAPIIVPPLASAMGIHLTFIRYGLADTFLGVMLVHLTMTVPYTVRVFTSVFKAMGGVWEEQARVLKANAWQRFWYVTLPFLRPGLVTGAILAFNVSFSQYFLTFLIGGGRVVTLPMLLFPYVNGGDRVIASVLSMIFVATALLFMFAVERVITDQTKQAEYYYL